MVSLGMSAFQLSTGICQAHSNLLPHAATAIGCRTRESVAKAWTFACVEGFVHVRPIYIVSQSLFVGQCVQDKVNQRL